jgi:hypothetical protein
MVPVPSKRQVDALLAARVDRDQVVTDAVTTGVEPVVSISAQGGVIVDGTGLADLALSVTQLTLRFEALMPLSASVRPETGEDAPAPGSGARSRELRELHGQVDTLLSSLTALQVVTELELDREARAEALNIGMDEEMAGHAATGVVQTVTRTSPSQVRSRIAGCKRVARSMPGMFTMMATGQVPVPVAAQVGTAARGLSREGLDILDAALVQDTPLMEGKGTRAWGSRTRELAGHLEPDTATGRHREARRRRYVQIIHEGDGMSRLSAVISTLDAVAIGSMLRREAECLAATGQTRRGQENRATGQIEADLLVDTLLGGEGAACPVGIDLQITMDADTLLAPNGEGVALINGEGPVPAGPIREQLLDTIIATADQPDTESGGVVTVGDTGKDSEPPGASVTRDDAASQEESVPPGYIPWDDYGLLEDLDRPAPRLPAPTPSAELLAIPGISLGTSGIESPDTIWERRHAQIQAERSAIHRDATVTLRRLFTHPDSGQLVAMESRARFFPTGLAKFLRLRDRECRAPYCDASIRHLDHITPAANGGETSAGNGQGLCEHCNLVRDAYATTRSAVLPDGTHQVTWDLTTGEQVTTSSRPVSQPVLPTTAQATTHIDKDSKRRKKRNRTKRETRDESARGDERKGERKSESENTLDRATDEDQAPPEPPTPDPNPEPPPSE